MQFISFYPLPPLHACQVYGLPALVLFKDGAVVAGSKKEGAITKAKLKEYLVGYGVQAKVTV